MTRVGLLSIAVSFSLIATILAQQGLYEFVLEILSVFFSLVKGKAKKIDHISKKS